MITEYVKQPLLNALDDRSSYVRRTAVIGCAKLFKIAQQDFEGIFIAFVLQTSCVHQFYIAI